MSEAPVTPNSEEPPISTEPPTPPVEAGTEPSLVAEPPKTEEPAAEFVPLTAEDIILAEGFTADTELQTQFLEAMNNQELSAKDRANALVDLQAKLMTKASEAGSAAWDNMQSEWRDAVKADPEVGGDKMVGVLASVSKLVSEYGDDKLTEVFNLTGAGNNVHVIKFLNKIAGQLTESSSPASGSPVAQGSAAQRMYPSMKG